MIGRDGEETRWVLFVEEFYIILYNLFSKISINH